LPSPPSLTEAGGQLIVKGSHQEGSP